MDVMSLEEIERHISYMPDGMKERDYHHLCLTARAYHTLAARIAELEAAVSELAVNLNEASNLFGAGYPDDAFPWVVSAELIARNAARSD